MPNPGFKLFNPLLNRATRITFFERLHRALMQIELDDNERLPRLVVFDLERAIRLPERITLFGSQLGNHELNITAISKGWQSEFVTSQFAHQSGDRLSRPLRIFKHRHVPGFFEHHQFCLRHGTRQRP